MGYLNKEVNRLVGQAIHSYGLLSNGDRILVAVSGGADSLLTLWFLKHWLAKAPIRFTLLPVHLDMGFEEHGRSRTEVLKRHFSNLDLSFHMEETDFGPYAHGPENRGKSPCFLCSMLRRKRLFELADRLDCTKIALGHNRDDLVETFFLNLLYVGELSTMVPRQEMFGGKITIIRPLALVEKRKIDRLARELRLPVTQNLCPSAGFTKRQEVKDLLERTYAMNPKIRGNIMRALTHVRPEYLPTPS